MALTKLESLASTLGVSESYAADICAGRRRPHPRHWQTLTELVGASTSLQPRGGDAACHFSPVEAAKLERPRQSIPFKIPPLTQSDGNLRCPQPEVSGAMGSSIAPEDSWFRLWNQPVFC